MSRAAASHLHLELTRRGQSACRKSEWLHSASPKRWTCTVSIMTLLGSEHSVLIRSKFRSGKSPVGSVWKFCPLAVAGPLGRCRRGIYRRKQQETGVCVWNIDAQRVVRGRLAEVSEYVSGADAACHAVTDSQADWAPFVLLCLLVGAGHVRVRSRAGYCTCSLPTCCCCCCWGKPEQCSPVCTLIMADYRLERGSQVIFIWLSGKLWVRGGYMRREGCVCVGERGWGGLYHSDT